MRKDSHIMICGMPRTGTNYLFNVVLQYMIKNNKKYTNMALPINNEFICSDPFQCQKITDLTYLETVTDHVIKSNNVVLKTPYHQLLELKRTYPYYYKKLMSIQWYCIILFRRNLFDTVISYTISDILHEWNGYEVPTRPIDIDADKLFSHLTITMDNWYGLLTNTISMPIHEIVFYEDLAGWPRKDFSSLDMCELPLDSLQQKQVRNIKRSPRKKDVVKNYDELFPLLVELLDSFYPDARETFKLDSSLISHIDRSNFHIT